MSSWITVVARESVRESIIGVKSYSVSEAMCALSNRSGLGLHWLPVYVDKVPYLCLIVISLGNNLNLPLETECRN